MAPGLREEARGRGPLPTPPSTSLPQPFSEVTWSGCQVGGIDPAVTAPLCGLGRGLGLRPQVPRSPPPNNYSVAGHQETRPFSWMNSSHCAVNFVVPQEIPLADGPPKIVQVCLEARHKVTGRRKPGESPAVFQPFQVEHVEDLLERPRNGMDRTGLPK